mmetsp:Transcript_29296/g.83284  ORF Transcript_29296/g.83284 Transcript_29296/m.83284 type:complete len:257 (+) Transcript_29296:883-1653(+)
MRLRRDQAVQPGGRGGAARALGRPPAEVHRPVAALRLALRGPARALRTWVLTHLPRGALRHVRPQGHGGLPLREDTARGHLRREHRGAVRAGVQNEEDVREPPVRHRVLPRHDRPQPRGPLVLAGVRQAPGVRHPLLRGLLSLGALPSVPHGVQRAPHLLLRVRRHRSSGRVRHEAAYLQPPLRGRVGLRAHVRRPVPLRRAPLVLRARVEAMRRRAPRDEAPALPHRRHLVRPALRPRARLRPRLRDVLPRGGLR